MFEYRIDTINHKFENIKDEVNNGKLLVYAKWEVEDLLDEANELKSLFETEEGILNLNALINQLNQYLANIQDLLDKNCSTTL